ncbi:MAG: hypothetical protein NTW26_06840 [bacterium]|nr:hypothetical protein [bacterium]
MLLTLSVCVSFLSCSTFTEVTPTEGGDLDWARGIADGVVAGLYDVSFVMFEVEATYLDFSGFLYGGVQHPFWRFSYINSDACIQVIVHPDGSTTVTEDNGYFDDEIMFTYTSADVGDWLALAQYCYRYITGLEDDVCYGFDAYCYEYGSYAGIYLYDSTFEELARVGIDLINGTIYSFDLY